MRKQIEILLRKALNDPEAEVTRSPRPELGHYATSIALKIAKKEGKNPLVVAEEVVSLILKKAPKNLFSRVEGKTKNSGRARIKRKR
jgi:arginyl-tRNA synthetase